MLIVEGAVMARGKQKEGGEMEAEMAKALKNISQNPFVRSSIRSCKQSRCSVLMIDDDYEYLLILSRFMASPSVQIEIESDWWEAVNKYCLSNFDLIVSDLNMPRYNGRDVFDYVHQYLKGVRMLFITALDDEGIRSFLSERIIKHFPVISKSKGISYVCNRIRVEINAWFDAMGGEGQKQPALEEEGVI